MNEAVPVRVSAPDGIEETLKLGVKASPWWKRWWVLGLAALLAVLVAWYALTPSTPIAYVTGQAELATIRSIITATGTLQPIDKVTVGAEVSGRMDEILVDFNAIVKKGQVLARLNTDELRARAVQTQATVAQVAANLAKAENDLDRAGALREKGFASKSVYDAALAARDSAKANLNSAKAQADQATANLAKAEIRSPIDGVVLDRKIERGQTVTAGFQTPELFVIASDLSQLELTIDIDEADIGEAAVGQAATFTVDAFHNRVFKAKVVELRNAARTIQNVVTYQGVLSVDNTERLLKPGMTATTDITVKVVETVMSVPNGALRFTPQQDERPGMIPTATVAPDDPTTSGKGRLWQTGKDGKLTSIDVTLGVSDGQRTQITSPNVKSGDVFVLDIQQPGRQGQP